MRYPQILLLLCLVNGLIFTQSADGQGNSPPCNVQDSLALVALYNAAGGSDWTHQDNWLQEGSWVREWNGVYFERNDTDRVWRLLLGSNNLVGTIPEEIGNLTGLQWLGLGDNHLTGDVPATMTNMSTLWTLDLRDNDFDAFPGRVFSLNQLEVFEYSARETEEFPDGFHAMDGLKKLFLGQNLSGEIPQSYSQIPNLEIFGLTDVEITGSMAWLSNLPKLEVLRIENSSIGSSLPVSLGELSSLRYIYLKDNDVPESFPLPASLGSLSSLSRFHVYNTPVTGQIPDSFENLDQLQEFIVFQGRLSGPLPDNLSSLTNLTKIDLSNNDVSGSVPASITNCSALRDLILGGNEIDALPVLTSLLSLANAQLQFNSLSFDDIVPNLGVTGFYYNNQDSVEATSEINIADETVTFRAKSGDILTAAALQYRWYQDGELVDGETGQTLVRDMAEVDEESTFRAEITHPTVPDFVLTTVMVRIGDGQAIVVNSVGDGDDNDLTDGFCYTGSTVSIDGVNWPECTLRAAISTVNQVESGENQTISFAIPAEGLPVIAPQSELPTIERSVLVDGTSQPGAEKVELAGSLLDDPEIAGLTIAGNLMSVRGLVITDFPGFGIEVRGGQFIEIYGNWIGFDSDALSVRSNAEGGVQIKGDVTDAVIGGDDEDQHNYIAGGIVIAGDGARYISVLQNVMELEEDQDVVLIDLSPSVDEFDDGPSCSAWNRTDRSGPNEWMPSPRILEAQPAIVRGVALPNARVFLYEVLDVGTEHRRYFARKVKPVAEATAADDGFFRIEHALAVGTQITALAIDQQGNTSEFAQLKRPVIFIPEIGGTWLKGTDGTNLWPPFDPIAGSAEDVENRLDRLEHSGAGNANETVVPFRLIEQYLDLNLYGKLFSYLTTNEYEGHIDNAQPATQDLWRFPYDWRKSSSFIGLELWHFVNDFLRDDIEERAWTCDVDLLTHGMGGYAAAKMVRAGDTSSRNSINKLITLGTGWHGYPQTVWFHTRGQILLPAIFNQRSIVPHEGAMIRRYRNMPSLYAGFPSREYFSSLHKVGYLEDYFGDTIDGWDNTFRFLTAAPFYIGSTTGDRLVDASSGLGRNKAMLNLAQSEIHDAIDVWTDWSGPPFLVQFMGSVNSRTPLSWGQLNAELSINEMEHIVALSRLRETQDDTDEIILYREGQAPILGGGDGWVTQESALAGTRVAGKWIRPPVLFNCDHFDLIDPMCLADGEATTLGVELAIQLKSSYEVMPTAEPPITTPHAKGVSSGAKAELFYVLGTRPVAAYVSDASGKRTGRVSPDSLTETEADVSDVGYWGGLITQTFSIPVDTAYSLTIRAGEDSTRIRLYRMVVSGESRETVLYGDQLLAPRGSMILDLIAGGTPSDAPIGLDMNGDGIIEISQAPLARVTSETFAPAVPKVSPQALDVHVTRDEGDVAEVTLSIGSNTDVPWEWELAGLPDWIVPIETEGLTPSEKRLTIDSYELEEGRYVDTLVVTLSIQDYSFAVTIPVELEVRDEAATLSNIVVTPDSVGLAPGEQQQFTAAGFDQVGAPFEFAPIWTATGGTIDASGLYIAGESGGYHIVLAGNSDQTVMGSAVVTIAGSGVGAETGLEPTKFHLTTGHPNPAQNRITFSYGLADTSPVQLVILDLLGKLVSTPLSGTIQRGLHHIQIDTSRLSTGAYIVHLRAGASQATQMMLVVH